MYERLSAPQASRGCLDPATLRAIDEACRAAPPRAGVENPEKVSIEELRELLRTSLEQADERLARRFWDGEDVVQLVRARAWVVEQLLLLAWHRLVPGLESLCLIAVGGFGRGELHPHSDVDLLILLDDSLANDPPAEPLESFIQLLWDAGFYLGHSVRTVGECVEEARDDVSTATTLMECRLLDGPDSLFLQLERSLDPTALWPADAFFEAKFEEQQERHARFHETAYNLEPNIKEGPGGLRDIQMIGWVAKRHFGAQTLHGLVEHGFLTENEHTDLVNAQSFLWRVRFALHRLAGRAEDRLLFDFQRDIAQRFGYSDSEYSLGVEKFMQAYYRTVMQLERLNERLLQLFQEALLFTGEEPIRPLGDEFQVRHGFLETRDEGVFLRRPAALMEMFLQLARHEDLRGVTASTIRLVRDNLYLVDDAFRADPTVSDFFLDLLRQPEGVYTQLQRMNRYGLLAEFIPAFGNIVGRMQYDLFHVYTVDQHTLFVVRNLRRFAYGKYRERFPHVQSVFQRIARPELLYLAALFHDIAKGRGGDHSELGAVDAREFCDKLEIDTGDAEMIAWLVQQHLLMSRTAQRKDLTDPAVIQEFAGIVGNTRYLDYLYLLTVADIAATNPKLWNSWKNGLLWDLYLQAGAALRRGLDNPMKRATAIRETRSGALSRLLRREVSPAAIRKIWRTLPENAFLRLTVDQLVWATSEVLRSPDPELQIAVRGVQPHGVSELLVCVPDTEGLFASITSVLDDMGLNVMAARILTTKNGRSFDLFQLMDQHNRVLNQQDTAELIQRLEAATATDEVRPPAQRAIPRRLKHFITGPSIRFEDRPDGLGTRLELECNDQPGLLSQVATTLSRLGVQVHDARIATFGERVEDTFMVSDRDNQPLTREARQTLADEIRKSLEKD
ncbi:[protein-PII] uridylyltransferase [Elongatibacter sediminis]|uniref:Bifunctional uridylyltransferase/uridylyl-removing enzyme n=1 Tax=Elongatibacter sediminis TaxID=3119006 RepID=A0AAW9RL16_9GAMM